MHHTNYTEWLNDIEYLEEIGRSSSAIDLVFDHITDLLEKQDFCEVDSILKDINVNDLSENIIYALLAVTLGSENWLDFREDFFERSRKELISRNKYYPNTLRGLH